MTSSSMKLYNIIHRVLENSNLTTAIIVLFMIQSLWISFSFRYPMLYDENFHFDAIKLFSQQVSPFISSQPVSYDVYGSLMNGGATMFHYLMSFPYRTISMFTDNLAIQVILLRVVNIIMAAVGILAFIKLFKIIDIKLIFINISIFLFILLPIVPFVASTINYDNMLFMLTPLFLIFCVKILLTKKILWHNFAWLVSLGCLASLVKFTFLPVFAISLVYLAIFIFKNHGMSIFLKLRASLNSSTKLLSASLIVTLLVLIGMFSAVYLKNIVTYGSLQPSCQKQMSQKRCGQSGALIRSENAIATIDTRPLIQNPEFISAWTIQMANWTNMSGSSTANTGVVVREPLPVIYTTFFVASFLAIGFLLYSWRGLDKNIAWYFLATVSVGLILIVFMQNYTSYIELHVAYGIQPRYLLTVAPIIIVMSVISIGYALRVSRPLKLTSLLIVVLLFTQGGGVVTAILLSGNDWYWQNPKVLKANHIAKKILEPLVKRN